MGLIPINADPRLFEFHETKNEDEEPTYTENDCIKFKLHVKCTKKDQNAPMIINNTHDEDKLYNNSNVYSSHLEWIPIGNQKERFSGKDNIGIRPLFEDILIAKLRPG